jgi:hypothetical protein
LKIRIWEIILNWISGMVCEDVIWYEVTQGCVQWQDLVPAVLPELESSLVVEVEGAYKILKLYSNITELLSWEKTSNSFQMFKSKFLDCCMWELFWCDFFM